MIIKARCMETSIDVVQVPQQTILENGEAVLVNKNQLDVSFTGLINEDDYKQAVKALESAYNAFIK